ncbi:unnamed protein product [Sympodiomycopsis kandeliae]
MTKSTTDADGHGTGQQQQSQSGGAGVAAADPRRPTTPSNNTTPFHDPLLSPSRSGARTTATITYPTSPLQAQPLTTWPEERLSRLEDDNEMSRNYNTISGPKADPPLRDVYDDDSQAAVGDDTATPQEGATPRRPGIRQTDSANSRQGLGVPGSGPGSGANSPLNPNPRSISFKRRAPSSSARARNVSSTTPGLIRPSSSQGHGRIPSGAQPGSATPGNLSGFINRASFGALGRPQTPNSNAGRREPRKSFAAVSQASSDAVNRWRNMRRVHTLSVHPPISGDPEDPSSWSFPEPKPQIPTLLPNPEAPPSNPIPLVPFTVLCLVCFGEFSSAGVAGPFLFFMIESFKVGGESEVGFWAGIVSSVFFFAQFLTSLLWASIAEKYGRRSVLLASLCGNAITLAIFGASTNLKMAITVRLAQGLFNGAVGVAKGAIRDLTDSTNEGRAYAILGFAWGFGGILGPILGGVLEHPVDKFPWLFGNMELFKQYPYLLPCLAGASFTTLGAFLSLFIGPDGGPREGRIKLETSGTAEEGTAAAGGNDMHSEHGGTRAAPSARNPFGAGERDASDNANGSLTRSAGKRISGYFGQDGQATHQSGGQGTTGSSDTVRGGEDHNSAAASSISMAPTGAGAGLPRTFTQQVDEETGGPPSPIDSDDEGTIVTASNRRRIGANQNPTSWRFSRTEERRRGILGGGTAYGYEPSSVGGGGRRQSRSSALSGPQELEAARQNIRNRQLSFNALGAGNASANNSNINANRLSFANSAMGSAFDYAPDFEAVGEDPALAPQPRRLNFAQRFLLANDDAVSSITDLWVAAAINGDEAYSALDDEDYFDEGEEGEEGGEDGDEGANDSQVIDGDSSFDDGDSANDVPEDDDAAGKASGITDPRTGTGSAAGRRPYLPPLNFAQRRSTRAGSSYSRPRSMRLGSFAAGRMPSLYSNTGIDLPSPWSELPPNVEGLQSPEGSLIPAPAAAVATKQPGGYDPTLAGIPESASARNTVGRGYGEQVADERQRLLQDARPEASNIKVVKAPAQPSLFALLPMTIIAHYALMAFHSATVDQVFMAFLVTPYSSGGLGLTAAHYAELISAMAFCQIGFQFYFYPKIGPPQGKWSHLSMMRLGTLFHPIAYLSFPLLRNFLHPSTDALVMTFMILFASMRWLANVCAFTAVSILMNALCPPNLVPLANGLAQTTSSAARFIGPIIGGVVWAKGIEGGVENHSWPLNYHLGFEFVGLVAFCGFLHAFFVLKSS